MVILWIKWVALAPSSELLCWSFDLMTILRVPSSELLMTWGDRWWFLVLLLLLLALPRNVIGRDVFVRGALDRRSFRTLSLREWNRDLFKKRAEKASRSQCGNQQRRCTPKIGHDDYTGKAYWAMVIHFNFPGDQEQHTLTHANFLVTKFNFNKKVLHRQWVICYVWSIKSRVKYILI